MNIPSHNQGKSNPHVKSSKTCCMLSHILIGARIILRVLWDSKPTNLQVVICWEDYLGMTLKSLRIRLFTNGVVLKASCVHNDTSWRNMCVSSKNQCLSRITVISGRKRRDFRLSQFRDLFTWAEKNCPTNKFFNPKKNLNISLHCWGIGVLFSEYVGKVFDSTVQPRNIWVNLIIFHRDFPEIAGVLP